MGTIISGSTGIDKVQQLVQFEMIFDDDRDGTTTWVDKINEIKGRHPK